MPSLKRLNIFKKKGLILVCCEQRNIHPRPRRPRRPRSWSSRAGSTPSPCAWTTPGAAGAAPPWRRRPTPRDARPPLTTGEAPRGARRRQCESGLPVSGRPLRGSACLPAVYLFRLRGSPWQRLYFLPEPQGHGSLRLTPANSFLVSSVWCSTPPSPSMVGAV